MKEKKRKNNLISVLIVVMAYSVLRLVTKSPSIPTLSSILESSKEIILSKEFYINLCYTIKIVTISISISFVTGTLLGISCSMNNILYSLVMPIINSVKNIPSISLFPLFIVLMGIGDAPRITIIIWNSIYPIISTTLAGLNSVDKSVVQAAEVCGATKYQVYSRIKIPLATITILEGLKISIGNGFIAIIVAEMLGATKGLGYMILWKANTFKYSEMYFYILVVALIGFTINVAIEKLIIYVEKEIYYG